jgi:16S rRNA A1518/A1519 N6-dimethyltransferase RsmA/KsgA/DIM1 with predicted DNA glycosylase/AP lyase activity
MARDYDTLVSSATGFPYIGYESVLDTVVRRAGVKPGMRVLELGVG